MAFKVFGPAATAADKYDDKASYSVEADGVLKVQTEERQITYGPAGWWRVEEPPRDGGGWVVAL
jgi:hypothetical protein